MEKKGGFMDLVRLSGGLLVLKNPDFISPERQEIFKI
jgi:hypothetical protein